jgi:pimeloyl-ACP methyl ester carboxylesterase
MILNNYLITLVTLGCSSEIIQTNTVTILTYLHLFPTFVYNTITYMKHLLFIILLLPLCLFAQQDNLLPTGQYFTSKDGTRIHYEVQGKGIPVILVHGFMNTGNNWKRTMLYDTLLRSGFKVVTLDLRGNGRSDKPHTDAAYANDAEAKDIMQLAALLHLESYNVVGYSRGSIITARLLVLDKRVTKAVLGGMGEQFTHPEWPRRIQFYHALAADTVPALHDMVQNAKKNGLDIEALAYQQKEQPSTSAAELSKVHIPVAVICGDKDSANGNGATLASLIPGALFMTVPGEHNTAWSTKEFAEKIVGFLNHRTTE